LRSSADIFTLLQSSTLQNATGTALDRIGADEDSARLAQTPASGFVTISDSSFVKISTKVFQGTPAPIIGTTSINVVNATGFASTGNVYIGRGTTNYEGPIPYSSVSNNGTYWTITLTNPTLLFHNQNESVIFAQGGNRSIASSTQVQTQQGNTSTAVQFSTLYDATILDGETSISNVVVVSQLPGVSGNVTAGAIQVFNNSPFTGATVSNPLPLVNGLATEDDDTYRERIRNVRQSRAKATSLAITTNAIGVTSTDDNKRVVSASVVQRAGQPATLFIDDGTGYEEITEGIAIESFTDFALGGEDSFQVSASRPITKAFLEANEVAPYVLSSGMQLAFSVGGKSTSHTFNSDEFNNVTNANAYEVVASINGDATLLWSARTTQAGNCFAVFAKADTNEDIQLAIPDGIDSNSIFDFANGRVDTMRLYKNELLLNKDGNAAEVSTKPFSAWNTLSGSETLTIAVDGIEMAFDGSTFPAFTAQDFIDAETGFTTLAQNSVQAWAEVFNFRIPGITASVNSGLIVLTSNKGDTTASKISIISGSLVAKHMFDPAVSVGANSDYSLNRNTGMFSLNVPLVAGDKLSAGSINTRAFLQTPNYTSVVNVPATANLWFSVDGAAQIIKSGIASNSTLSITAPTDTFWGNRVRVSSTSSLDLFANVEIGDWAIFWDANFTNLKGAYKVAGVDTGGTFFDIEKKAMAEGRLGFASCKLADGRIFVCGGFGQGGTTASEAVASAEIFNPATNTWTSVPSMAHNRIYHTATLLDNGKVLVVGGSSDGTAANVLTSSELFDPTASTWTNGPVLSAGVWRHRALQLGTGFTGKTLIVGGQSSAGTSVVTCNLYDSTANTFSAGGSLATARSFHTATLLNSGLVLVTGGLNASGTVVASAEQYTASANTWATTGSLATARCGAKAVVLSSGTVMVVGGSSTNNIVSPTPLASTELFSSGSFTAGATMNSAAAFASLTKLTDNSVVRLGGFLATPADEVEIYNGTVWTVGALPPSSIPTVTSRRGCKAFETTANNLLMFGGQETATPFGLWATSELYNKTANTWSVTESATQSAFVLASSGLAFVRSNGVLTHVTIPSGSTYTAPTLVAQLNEDLNGAVASVYRTTSIRTNTNTFALTNGSIALVAADTNADFIEIPEGDATLNLTGHMASVESANSDLGTPEFRQLIVTGSADASDPYVAQSTGGSTNSPLEVSESLVGLRDRDPSLTYTRYGNNVGFHSHVKVESGALMSLRDAVENDWMPQDRAYLASTFAIGPDDDLTVVSNNDPVNSRFSINMYRDIYPINATYGSQNTFRDADNGNTSLAASFGINYDFNDFAVYMAARVQTDPASSTDNIVFRYKRLGPDGNTARIHYTLPTGPSQPITVSTVSTNGTTTDISVALASGPLRTGYSLRATNKIGLVCTQDASSDGLATVDYVLGFPVATASRTSNVTTLTLTLPSGVTSSGLAVGDLIFTKSTNVNFISAAYTLLSASGATVTYAETGADQTSTANIGTISNGSTEATLTTSPAIAVNDFFRLENAIGSSDPAYTQFTGQTMRISSIPNTQTIVGRLENFTQSAHTTIAWFVVNDTTSFKPFINGPNATTRNLASAIVTAINAMDATVPVTAALASDGTGAVLTSSADAHNLFPYWLIMTDGLNYVETTISPGSSSGDYQFIFKLPVNASLATNSDWADERMRLVPVTTKNVVNWLNTPTVTGLFTDCSIQNSSQGVKVQISSLTAGSAGAVQVQGGLANSAAAPVVGSATTDASTFASVTINTALNEGFFSGMWVAVNNTQKLPKAVFNTNTNLTSITNNIDLTATFILNSAGTPIWTRRHATSSSAVVQIENQGKFAAYNSTALGSFSLSSVQEGDWAIVSTPVTPSGVYPEIESVNTGIFRVVRIDTGLDGTNGTFWIENLDATGESRLGEQALAECDITFYTPDSMMPGDTIQISTSLWGAKNKGVWTITSVGSGANHASRDFTDAFSFTVDASVSSIVNVTSSPGNLGTQSNLVQCIEAAPQRLIKRILGMSPTDDPDLYSVKFDTWQGAGHVNSTAGSIVNALDKLGFTTTIANGIDGYTHSVGLIGEVNRVIYGDASDPATYPGVVALGTVVNISGPLVKSIEIALQIRVATGVQTSDVESQVQSAVAALINQSGIGQAIAFSDIIDAARMVQGVVSVVIISPTYSASSDLINLQPYEKGLVLSNDNITISFLGN
jgi:hypothetical protein